MKDFRKIITREIARQGWSQYALTRRSGVPQGTLSKFLAGGGLHIDNVSRLCEVLGLELRPKKRR